MNKKLILLLISLFIIGSILGLSAKILTTFPTGQTTKDDFTKLIIYPSEDGDLFFDDGEIMTLKIIPGKRGVEKGIKIFLVNEYNNEDILVSECNQFCRFGNACFLEEEVQCLVGAKSSSDDAVYYIAVKDIFLDSYIKKYFRISAPYQGVKELSKDI